MIWTNGKKHQNIINEEWKINTTCVVSENYTSMNGISPVILGM